MLEFNPPVHGTWNIVHIGMSVPESHQIYVCAVNCMRGVVMTAAEMGAASRFSCVTISERDFYRDNLETVTIEGTARVLENLPKLPPLVFLFTVCVHKFAGTDLDYCFRELEKRFPTVCFVRAYMDPISQKEGPTPDEELRSAMFTPIPELPEADGRFALLGCDAVQKEDSDLINLAARFGKELLQLSDCSSYDAYRKLGEAAGFLCTYPNARTGVSELAGRLARPYGYLPVVWDFDRIEEELEAFSRICFSTREELPKLLRAKRREAEEALLKLKECLGDTPVVIDYTAVTRPVGLAGLLLSYGIRVRAVCFDACIPEEERELESLKREVPDLSVLPTIDPKWRGGNERRALRKTIAKDDAHILAVGQKAAWLLDTPYFVNMIEDGGLFGYAGIIGLCREMTAAAAEPKPMHAIVPQKGLGCQCQIQL